MPIHSVYFNRLVRSCKCAVLVRASMRSRLVPIRCVTHYGIGEKRYLSLLDIRDTKITLRFIYITPNTTVKNSKTL